MSKWIPQNIWQFRSLAIWLQEGGGGNAGTPNCWIGVAILGGETPRLQVHMFPGPMMYPLAHPWRSTVGLLAGQP